MDELTFLTELRSPKRSDRKPKGHGEGGQFHRVPPTMKRSHKGRTYPVGGRSFFVATLEEWQRAGLCGGRVYTQEQAAARFLP